MVKLAALVMLVVTRYTTASMMELAGRQLCAVFVVVPPTLRAVIPKLLSQATTLANCKEPKTGSATWEPRAFVTPRLVESDTPAELRLRNSELGGPEGSATVNTLPVLMLAAPGDRLSKQAPWLKPRRAGDCPVSVEMNVLLETLFPTAPRPVTRIPQS